MSGKRPNGDASGDVLSGLAPERVFRNLSPAALVTAALARGEARLAATGALVAETGRFTGRSPNDKYVVEQAGVREHVDWGPANQALPPERFARLLHRAFAHLHGRDVFVQDLFAGADPAHRLKVRVITEEAWHGLFARNMFIRPAPQDLVGFEPDWKVLGLPSFEARPQVDGTRTPTVVAIDFVTRYVLIGGTRYAGELKKSIFTVLNYLLPPHDVLPMHCSANVDEQGRVAVFFGLSGTGKTTLSADFDPHADRRRRARLGRERRLQLRGRLLRQGDPPRPAGRARDLGGVEPVRGHPRERRARPGHRRAALRGRQPDGEHAQLLPARLRAERQPDRHAPATPTRS